MSTYNVGFTITSFNQSQFHDYEGLKLNLTYWSRDVSHQSPGNIAMGFSAQFLNVIGKALDMNYTLPKMDIVVIPEYAVPVRECWGLIIWQEEFLLQETVALFGLDSMGPVANQMVRQWFENLVTIKSWSDSWFAEGFCMFVVKIAVSDFMSPKLELFSFDITVNLISVFDFDSLENTQAVSSISSNVSTHFHFQVSVKNIVPLVVV